MHKQASVSVCLSPTSQKKGTMSNYDPVNDPQTYVQEKQDTIIEVVKYGSDNYVRALCLAALIKYGEDPDIDRLKKEIAHLDEMQEELG